MQPAAESASTPIAEDPPLRGGGPVDIVQPLLLVLPMFAWIGTDVLEVDIGFARNAMRVAVDVQAAGWPTWALLPLLTLAVVALRGGLSPGGWPQRMAAAWLGIRNVLTWIRLPLLALIILRLLSLWNPAGIVLPWIGLAWAPHASVALALTPLLSNRQRSSTGRRRTAVGLLTMFLMLYGGYTLYICQMVMIHGDEAQYLRVTQSLLQDGDMDLANNLDGDITDFHVMDVGVDRAPGTPGDKVYSLHPVGLSVGLMPAYEFGRSLWSNPRLGAALAIAACAAATVALLYLWLCHLGFAHGISFWVVLACASSTPLLLFSTQVYPELPTVFVTLLVLLRLDPRLLRPLSEQAGEQTEGARSAWEFAGLALMAGTLPFLHPRYAPLAGLLGAGLLWQARAQRRHQAMVIGTGLICGIVLMAHNFSFSGDWLGNFRPGNAWDENALDPSTWWMSLPGHWLHVGKGLALNSPWYFVAVVAGVAVLATQRDRRLLAAAGLYGATAMVNGIHPDWTFGFCLPARFVVTALPALALCAAAGVDVIRRSPWLGVLFCGALAVSWDTTVVAIHMPELAFQGNHLARAAISQFYPVTAHGFLHTLDSVPGPDVLLWMLAATAIVAVCLSWSGSAQRLSRLLVVAVGLLGPALWGLSAESTARLRTHLSPYLKMLVNGEITGVTTMTSTFRKVREGDQLEDGGFVADGSSRGTLAAYFMPIQVPGLYRIVTDGVVATDKQTAFVSHQRTLPAQQPWGEHMRIPVGAGTDSIFRFDYYLDRLQFGYLHFVYGGSGVLKVGASHQDLHARTLPLRLEETARFDLRQASGPYAARDNFSPGSYVARFRIAGGALSTMTQRQPVPVKMAVVVTDGANVPFEQLQPWFDSRRRMQEVISGPDVVQPQREALVAPWWVSVPVVGDSMYELNFLVRRPGPVWVLFQYDGEAHLHLEEIVVYRQQLDMERP